MRSIGLSNSEMKEFQRCRRKWWLSTYRRLGMVDGREPGSHLSVGNFVHEALAAYYDPVDSVDPLLYAEAKLGLMIEAKPEFEKSLRKEYKLVSTMLGGYLEWLAETGVDSQYEVLSVEKVAKVPLTNAKGKEMGVTLISKIDAVRQHKKTKALSVLEHKTVGSSTSERAITFGIEPQYLTEQLVLHLKSLDAKVESVHVNMLRKVLRSAKAKPPFYEREEVTHSIEELRTHWKHVISIATEIEEAWQRLDAGESHHTACPPNPVEGRCSWDCDFFRVCRLADSDPDAFEESLEVLFQERDPLARYEGVEEL